MKLPVFRTLGNALGFAFGSYFTIFRLTWLPFAMLIAGSFVVGLHLHEAMTHGAPIAGPLSLTAHLDEFAFVQIAVLILQAIAIAAAAVSVHRVILFNERKPGVYFNFPFGGTEFLYVLMGMVWLLIVLLIVAVVFTPFVLLITHGDVTGFFAKLQETFKDWPPKPGHEADMMKTLGTLAPLMGAYFIFWIIAIYVGLRLAVWPPAIVATRRFALGEAWALTRGNVLRLLGLFVLVILLFYALFAIPAGAAYWYYTSKMRPAELEQPYDTKTPAPAGAAAPGQNTKTITNETTITNAPPPPATNDTPTTGETPMPEAQRQAKEEEIRREMERGMGAFAIFLPLFWFIELVVDVFATGLGVALLSYSYKALKGIPAREAITDGG